MPIVADAAVAVRGDLSRFSSDLRGADTEVKTLGQRLKSTLSPRNLGIAGAFAAGAGAFAAVNIIKDAIRNASDLNEEIDKSSVVFGNAAPKVQAFADSAAAIGLSKEQALGAAGAFGNMFSTIGLAQEESADMSTTMVQLAADMASFNNEDPSDMLDRLRSGLAGEAEPLRRFGVLLSEAAIQEFAVRTGIVGTNEALTEAQKVHARFGLILEQTAIQQGNFALTSGSLANQQRELSARLDNVSAALGTKLLPIITKVVSFISDVGVPALQFLIDNPLAALLAISPLIVLAIGAIGGALALLLSPIGLVVLAVGALFIAWQTNFLGIRTVAESVVKAVGVVMDAFMGVFRAVAGAIGGVVAAIVAPIQGIVGIVAGVANAIADFFGWLSGETARARRETAALGDFGAGSSAGGAGGSSRFGPPKPPPTAARKSTKAIPKFAMGAWNVPRDMLALLHAGEHVSSAGPQADSVRGFLSGAASVVNKTWILTLNGVQYKFDNRDDFIKALDDVGGFGGDG